MIASSHAALRRAARARVGADLYCKDVARLEVRAAFGMPVIARTTLADEPVSPDADAVATVELFVVLARTVLHHVTVTPAVILDSGRARLIDRPTPARDLLRWAWWAWRLGALTATEQEIRDLVDQLLHAHPYP